MLILRGQQQSIYPVPVERFGHTSLKNTRTHKLNIIINLQNKKKEHLELFGKRFPLTLMTAVHTIGSQKILYRYGNLFKTFDKNNFS